MGGYSGDAGDAFNHPYSPAWSSNGMRFSTKDNDNDQYGGACAVSEGWWFNWCTTSSLNRLPAIWSDTKAIADVQASRMWVTTGTVGRNRRVIFICFFARPFVHVSCVCSTTRKVVNEVG